MATIAEVKKRFSGLQRMGDLRTDEFAEEGGLADSLAVEFGVDLKPTQLRKVFSEIKRIRRQVEREARNEAERQQSFDRTRLLKLMPTLAYSVGRRLIPEDFYDILKLSLGRERLQTNADFIRAADFIEAVLAYHKYRS
jgi:CRISPR type III-A-associated protein Csm2